MFFVEEEPTPRTRRMLSIVKKQFGSIPPHFELLATLNPKRFELLIREIFYLAAHEKIDPDLFAFLRFYVAAREGFGYCLKFNTGLLLAKGHTEEILESVRKDIASLPLDDQHVLLATKALKAVYEGESFGKTDHGELQDAGWSTADIYDAIDHAAFLFRHAKVIKAYSS
jgi:hypothetical protein